MSSSREADRHATEARRVQAKTWIVLAVLWMVIAAVVSFDTDVHPVVRGVLVFAGLAQAGAGVLWWRRYRRDG
jgi:hypothetical protein